MADLATLIPLDEAVAERVAHIIGPSGSMGLALDEMKRRRAAGETVGLFRYGNTVVVGPPVSPTLATDVHHPKSSNATPGRD